jgi:hypothetical protein
MGGEEKSECFIGRSTVEKPERQKEELVPQVPGTTIPARAVGPLIKLPSL